MYSLFATEPQAESPGEGQGTTFIVKLPQRDLPQETTLSNDLAPTAIDSSSDPVPALEGLQILAVDDEGDTRKLFKFVLESYGAENAPHVIAPHVVHLLFVSVFHLETLP